MLMTPRGACVCITFLLSCASCSASGGFEVTEEVDMLQQRTDYGNDAACDADSVIWLQEASVKVHSIQQTKEGVAINETRQGAAINGTKEGAAINETKEGADINGTKEGAAINEATSSVKVSAAIAEYVAMTLFVIIGCGSAMGVAKEPGWVLQVALTFGLAISSLAYAVGHYSGGQINCAVTLALVVAGKVSLMQGLLNFGAQVLGAITGALILTQICPEEQDKTGDLATNSLAPGISQLNAFVGEFMMTFLLVFVVFETAVNPASKANSALAALAIGFAVFLAHSVLIPIDGCSINPTRTLGPALVRKFCYKEPGSFEEMWIFFVGPLSGAVTAGFVSTWLMG